MLGMSKSRVLPRLANDRVLPRLAGTLQVLPCLTGAKSQEEKEEQNNDYRVILLNAL